jgi:hypothetical protein
MLCSVLCSVLLPCYVCCLLKSKCKAFTILTGPWCPMERVISSGGDFFSAPDGTLRAVVCHMHPPLRPHARGNGKTQRVSSHTHLKLHHTAYHCPLRCQPRFVGRARAGVTRAHGTCLLQCVCLGFGALLCGATWSCWSVRVVLLLWCSVSHIPHAAAAVSWDVGSCYGAVKCVTSHSLVASCCCLSRGACCVTLLPG